MKMLTYLLVGLLLAACATSKPIQGPNGSTTYFIKCGSAVLGKCYEEAAKVCPSGYMFLDRDQNGNAVIVPTGNSLALIRGPISMLVQCKR